MNENHRHEVNIPVWANLAHTAARVEARLEAALADTGLSLAKFAVLEQLMKAGEPLLLTRLSERLSCCKSNITQLIDRLEADSLVQRVDAPEDRRSVLAALTAEGRRRYEIGSRTLAAAEQGLLKSFEGGELELLNKFLGRFNTTE
ncbi:MAG: MarR family transcriptional regulator [Candidatus Latescibacteria bacterium]|nr:MarR family transcriptional regulator [Candidatus Latescibacterota bacterium]